MISKLSEEAALDFLMTSEFEDSYSPSEMKEMLLKYRYFYRILHSRFERVKDDKEFDISKLQEVVDNLQRSLLRSQADCVKKQDEINNLVVRKLSFKERILGKIILPNENKGI